jgi:hypothetical protein
MALIQWKQLSSNLSGSGIFSGSLKVTGSIQVNGVDLGVSVDPSIFRRTGSYFNATSNIGVTGSLKINISNPQDSFSVISSGSELIKVTSNGVLQFASQSQEPTPVAGGIFFSSSNEFFFGF